MLLLLLLIGLRGCFPNESWRGWSIFTKLVCSRVSWQKLCPPLVYLVTKHWENQTSAAGRMLMFAVCSAVTAFFVRLGGDARWLVKSRFLLLFLVACVVDGWFSGSGEVYHWGLAVVWWQNCASSIWPPSGRVSALCPRNHKAILSTCFKLKRRVLWPGLPGTLTELRCWNYSVVTFKASEDDFRVTELFI